MIVVCLCDDELAVCPCRACLEGTPEPIEIAPGRQTFSRHSLNMLLSHRPKAIVIRRR